MKYYVSVIIILILTSVLVHAQQEAKGVTTIGTAGVSETVGEIMAKQILGAHPKRFVEAEKEMQYPKRNNLAQNPNSPLASQYSNSREKIKQQNNILTSLSKGLNFTGASTSSTSTLYVPPDNMGAVGPTQYIIAINSRIITFNKTTGVADGALNADLDVFFSSVETGGPSSPAGTSDPHIRYDRLSKRWIIDIIDIPSSVANRVLIAVSADSIITASTVFKFFYYQASGSFIDYPTLGIDKNAIYIGGNLFSTDGTSFLGTMGLVVQKSSIMASGPMVATYFSLGTSSTGLYTPQGVDNLYDMTATEGYFIGVDAAAEGLLDLVRVSNPGSGSPTLANVNLTVPSTYQPGLLSSTGSSGYYYFDTKPGGSTNRCDPDDERLLAAMIRNGHLWTAHHIETTNTGVGGPTATESGTATRTSARWYDIINFQTGSTPALNQSGTVYSSALTSTRDKNYLYPTITVNGQGHALMGFTTSGYYNYAQAGYCFRLSSNTLGTMQTPDSNTTTATAYNYSGESAPHRWGDYSMTEVDPSDNMTFWTIQQFCSAANNYGCQITQLKAPAPATLTSATPNVLGPGSNLTFVIKGDTTTGLGFYEPGPTFSKHLTAAIDGGIVVNSITYISPSTISLNVTTTGGTSGLRTITITNPDGQVATSSNIFTYNPTLPVELSSFTAEIKKANEIQLNWSTATEVNSQKFEIQRSVDKNNWTVLSSVNAAGNSNAKVNYSYTDKSRLSQGVYYYRLKQYDNDGASKELNTIEVNYNNIPSAFGLNQNYPNPFNPSTKISFQVAEKSNVNVSVYDILGNKVTTLVNETKTPGQYEISFDASHLSSGVYFYKMQADKFVVTKKMTVIK